MVINTKMDHNLIFSMLQEAALKNFALMQFQELFSQFVYNPSCITPSTNLPPLVFKESSCGVRSLPWQEEEDLIISNSVKLSGSRN